MEINPNPAQQIIADTTESFQDYANRIFKTSKKKILHGNGEPVELAPDSVYSTVLLKVTYLLSSEKFGVLEGIIGQSITQAEASGVIEKGWFQGLATPLDLHTPAIPEQYQEEGFDIKIFLAGEVGLVMAKTLIPEVEIDEQED